MQPILGYRLDRMKEKAMKAFTLAVLTTVGLGSAAVAQD